MKYKNFKTPKSILLPLTISLFLLFLGCSKVDDALDYALNFDGVFTNSQGWEVTLDGESSGVYTKAGTPMGNFTAGLGDQFCADMVRESETIWRGRVRANNGFSLWLGLDATGYGTITIQDNVLTVNTNAGESYSFTRVDSNSGGGSGTSGSGSSGGIYNGSKPTGNYWSRNDGAGMAYLSLSGSIAKACSGGKETVGTFNSSKPSMTFTIGKDVIEFPLLFTNGLLIVGVPNQAVTTNNPTQYVSATTYNCGTSGGTSGKGTIMVWSDVPVNGFKYGFNYISVDINGSLGTVYGGKYTSAPSCGATYCYTKEVAVGTYVVQGKVYPLKPLSGPTPPIYSVSYTVKIEANTCSKVVIR